MDFSVCEILNMEVTDDDIRSYTVNPYFNSDKEPMGLTINGKAKSYKLAHEAIKKSLKKGVALALSNGAIKVVELPFKKAMVNVIVEVKLEDENFGNVEMKIYEPSSKKNKGATIELRMLPDFQYEHVEQLKDTLVKLLDDIIAVGDPLNSFKRICHKKSKLANISSKPKRFVCSVCLWDSKLSVSLKAHMTKLHGQLKAQCT